METRSLEITVTSAKGIKLFSKNVFVAVKLHGDPKFSNHHEQRTNVIKDSSTSPKSTNSIIKFSIDEALAQANRLLINFKIKSERDKTQGDQDIGEVHVPVKELLDHLGNDKTGQRYVTYKVNNKPNGKPIGDISFTYSFTGPVTPTSDYIRPRYLANDQPRPAASRPMLNRPILSQLLPSVGSFSYNDVPSPPPVIYPPMMAQPEISPPACFPGLYPPQGYPTTGYIPESPPQAMYPMVGPSMYPGSSFCPPEGYPTVDSPQMQPGLYPPMSPYRF